MRNPVLKIERLDSGKYLATVTGCKYGRICDTLQEAARWAEGKLDKPTQASPEEFEKFWRDQ